MAVRSKRVAGPMGFSNAGTLIYTVPAGETFRGMAWFTNKDAIGAQLIEIFVGALFANNRVWAGSLQPNNVSAMNPIILNPGDTLWARSATASGGTIVLWGSELEGVAD